VTDALERLRNGVVLAELGGHGDGPYCAKHGAGSALVVMGTYIVDASDFVPYPPAFVFKPGRSSYADYLRKHVRAARESGAAVGVSVVGVDLDDTIDFMLAAEDAGADYVSLCLHSGMDMFVSVGLSCALLWRENWPRLRQHLTACLQAVRTPLIAKIGVTRMPDDEQAVGEMAAVGVRLVHANLGEVATDRGRDFIQRLKEHGVFLVAGGGIRSVGDARRAMEAGADAVAVGTAAMHDAALCGRLQAALRSSPQAS